MERGFEYHPKSQFLLMLCCGSDALTDFVKVNIVSRVTSQFSMDHSFINPIYCNLNDSIPRSPALS